MGLGVDKHLMFNMELWAEGPVVYVSITPYVLDRELSSDWRLWTFPDLSYFFGSELKCQLSILSTYAACPFGVGSGWWGMKGGEYVGCKGHIPALGASLAGCNTTNAQTNTGRD